ncbi:MAG TPA: glycosyltransferase [Terracidiphilus sp.]|nr:glycosyltransferase [Terracidiphilus sp.]
MKISVVITTYNRRSSLERCLKSLAAQNFPAEQYELVVVADGCSDSTVEFLEDFKANCALRWVAIANRGQPAAQNLGVTMAAGEIVLFLDDDCIASPQMVAAHHEAHAGGEKLVVVGAISVHEDSPAGAVREVVEELENAELERLRWEGAGRRDLLLCANSSIARSAALLFPFDTTYKRIHDVEAGVRLWAAGYRSRFAPGAVVHELYTKTQKAMMNDARNQGRNEIRLIKSHPEFRQLAGIVRIHQGSWLKRFTRRQMVLHCGLCDFKLRILYAIANSLRVIPPFAALARRILKARMGLAHLSGALEAAGSWELLEQECGRRIPVMMYHNVGTPRPGEYPGLSTPLLEFEKQVRFMAKLGFKGIRPSEWLQWRDEGRPLPKHPIMLVFDDAYQEACRTAFPVLERYEFGAACMVVTGSVGRENEWDKAAGLPAFQLMEEREILEWKVRGIEFGGHTRTHPDLRCVPVERVEQEIEQCGGDLTRLLGEKARSFAYPFGGANNVAEDAVRKNFELAFTTDPGWFHLGTNPYRVPRISFLPGETRFGMWCRLRLGRNLYEWTRNRWSSVRNRLGGSLKQKDHAPG